jgi:predicted transcriptional regulator
MQNYNVSKIKSRKSYSMSEMSSLLGVHRKTCSRWLKTGGLKVIEKDVSPLLVMGEDLINFILSDRVNKKFELKDNELFCLKCRKAVKSKAGSEQIVDTGKTIGKDNRKQFKKMGICEFCGAGLNKYLGVSQRD